MADRKSILKIAAPVVACQGRIHQRMVYITVPYAFALLLYLVLIDMIDYANCVISSSISFASLNRQIRIVDWNFLNPDKPE